MDNREVPRDTVFIWFFAKLSIMHRHNISSFLDLGAFSWMIYRAVLSGLNQKQW